MILKLYVTGNTMEKHRLSEYIKALSDEGLLVDSEVSEETAIVKIDCLTYDTRELTPNAIFICKGAHFKPEYASFAAENGAAALVGETRYEGAFPFIIVSDVRRAMATLAKLFFDDAPSKITSVGITGTKGKSTTAYYLRAIIDDWMKDEGRPECAVISSIDTYDGVERFESHLTTPEIVELYRHFSNAEKSGISHLVMEVSSQALKYGRVAGIKFDVACFMNIGTDHISPVEHADFEDYFSSKLKIFDICKTACINSDSDYADKILSYASGKCRIVKFGTHPDDDVYCKKIEKRDDAIFFEVRTPEFERELCITMPGIFNVSNALAAVAMSYVLGIPEKYVASGLAKARAAGRMQTYKSRDGRVVAIVDYAHNKMSFEALFNSVKVEFPGKKIIAVFGCPGGKAFLRRHDLAQAADAECDHIIITEEDSGEEPFINIAKDIASNIERCDYSVIEDRGDAIRKAVLELGDDERVILITGKGEETRLKRGMQYVDCPSDVELTISALKVYDEAAVAAN